MSINKVIRWPGLVAFVGVVAVLVAVVLLFAEPLLRWGLGAGLTRANGAEVNIETVELRWSPFAVELRELQFTDPETPELNRFQAERLSFGMRILDAMIGRIHIDELTATGIAMGVERESRGKVRADYIAEREAAGTPSWGDRLAALDITMPSTDELMQRSEIRTPQVVEEVTERTRETEDRVRAARDDLPDVEKVEDYEERLQALREMRPRTIQEFEQARERLIELREDIRADRDTVVAFKESVEQAQQQLSTDLQRLREAPGNDIDRIRRLISLDNDAISDLAGIFFGPRVQQWTDYILVAYDFVGPILQGEAEDEARPSRWEGRYIDFDRQNRPSFLIELAHTEMTFGSTSVDVRWDNVTWQHERLGSPTTYRVAATESPLWRSLSADGDFFIDEAASFRGSQGWSLQGAELAAQTLLEQSELTARLMAGTLDSNGRIDIDNGEFSGGGGIDLSNVELRADGEPTWVQMMNQALSQINAFSMDVGLAGRVGSPQLRLDSDLDNQLAGAFSGVLQEAADERLAEVRTRLQSELDSALGDVQPRLAQIETWRELAQNREAGLQELLDEEVSNLREGAKDELEDRLRDAIRGRLGGGN
ncbi:TIGR03545 family protein [Aliidiomarina sp. Khilg15.8]